MQNLCYYPSKKYKILLSLWTNGELIWFNKYLFYDYYNTWVALVENNYKFKMSKDLIIITQFF